MELSENEWKLVNLFAQKDLQDDKVEDFLNHCFSYLGFFFDRYDFNKLSAAFAHITQYLRECKIEVPENYKPRFTLYGDNTGHQLCVNAFVDPRLKEIPESAFDSCWNLGKVVIPEGVTSIGREAFCDCENLIEVNIPNSVKNIGEDIFAGCEDLTTVLTTNPTALKYLKDNYGDMKLRTK